METERGMDGTIAIGRPTGGDVVELILEDHRRFEDLLRQLRDESADRDAARRTFATLHVAHAEAEEREVYPTLRRRDAVSAHEAEHGEEEHAEGHEALLAVLESGATQGEEFDELVEQLATAVNHHISEEELTILNPARDEVATEVRERLGEAFATERNQQVDAGCGATDNVRSLVRDAQREGLIEK